jgi:hypothetical protein
MNLTINILIILLFYEKDKINISKKHFNILKYSYYLEIMDANLMYFEDFLLLKDSKN